jgi:ssDNA-binding Zn-finger/Zn-ribbon topoisomerase 1
MIRRLAKAGPKSGQPFWGCSDYPNCTGTRPINSASPSNLPDQSDRSHQSDRSV